MNKATKASDVIACPGCDAARASATRCVADPGPPQIAAVPGLQRTTSCCAAHGTRAPRRTAASCKEPTFACGRLRSIVSGLLFTMKTATRACDRSAGSAPLVQHPLVPAKAGPRNPDQSWLWIPAGVYPRESGGGNERKRCRTVIYSRARLRLRHERAPRRRRRCLFCRPGFQAAERCSSGAQSQAAFELQCRLKPGPGHFQQHLPVALRFGVAGPTHALLRELAEFFGGCGHGALYAGDRRERDRSLSHRRLRASRCR